MICNGFKKIWMSDFEETETRIWRTMVVLVNLSVLSFTSVTSSLSVAVSLRLAES